MILDTNAVSALLAGEEGVAAALGEAARHHLPVIVLGEYRYGLARSSRRTVLESLLDLLAAKSIVLPVDEAASRAYAEVREELRAAGTPIPENDVWIAALSRRHDLPVVSRDAHFDAVPGLERVAW